MTVKCCWQAHTLPLAWHPAAPPGKKRWSPVTATYFLAVYSRLAGVLGGMGGYKRGSRVVWGGFKPLLGVVHRDVRLHHTLKHSSSDRLSGAYKYCSSLSLQWLFSEERVAVS